MKVGGINSRLASRASARGGFTLLEVLVVVAILVILASVAGFAVMRYMHDAKLNQASLQMANIEQACKSYYTSTSGSNWPSSLQELVQASASGPPLLEGGQSAITDPWGKQYQISFEPDSSGSERLVIWTTSDTGQRLQWPRQ